MKGAKDTHGAGTDRFMRPKNYVASGVDACPTYH